MITWVIAAIVSALFVDYLRIIIKARDGTEIYMFLSQNDFYFF